MRTIIKKMNEMRDFVIYQPPPVQAIAELVQQVVAEPEPAVVEPGAA